ncbi:MAG: D-alanyl-D-alanine dipeptidase [Proteobacteria bacterium]|nr:D-alanyl-D-alanine dipeptidase [Pseudomonadota bacterium]
MARDGEPEGATNAEATSAPHDDDAGRLNRRELCTGVASVAFAALLSGTAAFARPPVEKGPFLAPDLVELITLDPSLKLDIRYATRDNFLGVVLYPEARAFMQRPAAEALVRAHRALRRHGLGLMIFDAYRPWRVTKLMWDNARPEWRKGGYVADPDKGSRHNRGCAVDLTLFERATGQPLDMPTGYDDFHEQAHAESPNVTPKAKANRELLQRVMLAQGFRILPEEWWHFDYKDYPHYGILDIDFAHVETRAGASTRQKR